MSLIFAKSERCGSVENEKWPDLIKYHTLEQGIVNILHNWSSKLVQDDIDALITKCVSQLLNLVEESKYNSLYQTNNLYLDFRV